MSRGRLTRNGHNASGCPDPPYASRRRHIDGGGPHAFHRQIRYRHGGCDRLVHDVPGRGLAAWEPLSDTAANIQKVCTDGIKFEAGIIKSFNRRENPYKAHAAVANPPPVSRPAPAGTVIVRQKINIYKYQKVVDLPDGGKLALSHYGKYELRFQHKQAVGDTVALGLKNFAEGSGITTATVTNCRLFHSV